MATPSLLEIDALLAPIPGDLAAGSSVPLEINTELDEMRREVDPDDFPPDDPMRPAHAKKADWAGIVRRTQELLRDQHKDLKLAARLTEALTRGHGPDGSGFAGLRDGLTLLRRLVEECWDGVLPAIEEPDDVERRATPFEWLSSVERGIRFPITLRLLPLLFGKAAAYSWEDWKNTGNRSGGPTAADIEQALREADPKRTRDVVEDLDAALEELTRLSVSLDDKMGRAAPALHALRSAVEDCGRLARDFSARGRPISTAETDIPSEGQQQGLDAASAVPGSRAEAYRQLRRAADVLRALEPHSPVPYLVERAIDLGDLPFPQMIRQLIRDANVLAELDRELGVKDGAPPPPKSD